MIQKLFILFFTGQAFLLWVYLLLNRKKHDIIFTEPISEYIPYLTYGLVLTSSLLLLISWGIYKTFINPATSKRFQKLTEKLLVFAKSLNKLNIFYTSYDIIVKHFGTGSPYIFFMIRIMKDIVDYSDKKLTIIIFSFVSLPRILVIVVLLTEVVIGHLHYYFYAIYLLLIPLLFRIILFLLKDVHERVFPEACAMVKQDVKDLGQKRFGLSYSMKPEYKEWNEEAFLTKYFFPLLFFGTSLISINNKQTKISLFTQCVYYLVHVICFSYILFIV